MRARSLAAGVLALSLVAAACGGDDDDAAEPPADETPAEEPAPEEPDPEEPATEEPAEEPGGTCDPLPTVEEGVLTVATGETAPPSSRGSLPSVVKYITPLLDDNRSAVFAVARPPC